MSSIKNLVKSLHVYDFETQATIMASCSAIYPAVSREPYVQAWVLLMEDAITAHSRSDAVTLTPAGLAVYLMGLPISEERTKVIMGVDWCITQAGKRPLPKLP